MIDGRIETSDLRRLMAGFEAGLEAGRERAASPPPAAMTAAQHSFNALPGTGPRQAVVLASRRRGDHDVEHKAQQARAAGAIVTILRLLPGTRRHRMRMREDGIWEQEGGLWGKSLRDDPVIRRWTFPDRIARETGRIAAMRPVDGWHPQ